MIKDLPIKLKDLRIKHGLSQKQVADKLNLSPSIISGYETGERTPSVENILALSYLYKCSTDYLLGKPTDNPFINLDTKGLTNIQIQAIQNLINTIRHE